MHYRGLTLALTALLMLGCGPKQEQQTDATQDKPAETATAGEAQTDGKNGATKDAEGTAAKDAPAGELMTVKVKVDGMT